MMKILHGIGMVGGVLFFLLNILWTIEAINLGYSDFPAKCERANGTMIQLRYWADCIKKDAFIKVEQGVRTHNN